MLQTISQLIVSKAETDTLKDELLEMSRTCIAAALEKDTVAEAVEIVALVHTMQKCVLIYNQE